MIAFWPLADIGEIVEGVRGRRRFRFQVASVAATAKNLSFSDCFPVYSYIFNPLFTVLQTLITNKTMYSSRKKKGRPFTKGFQCSGCLCAVVQRRFVWK